MEQHNTIPFIKMQGTGNDFVVIDNREEHVSPERLQKLAPEICHRKYGVGADGILALQKPSRAEADFTMIYRNADGSDAGMCGNGSRCLALYAHKLGMGADLTFTVHDLVYRATVSEENIVDVSFPVRTEAVNITVDGESLWRIDAGTEHVVKEVPDDKLNRESELVQEGRKLRYHENFRPKGTNANFFCGKDSHSLQLRTYERGVEDLTLACGTGAIASAIAWHRIQQSGEVSNSYEVDTRGGVLRVEFLFDPDTETYRDLRLGGPAHFVFEGVYYV